MYKYLKSDTIGIPHHTGRQKEDQEEETRKQQEAKDHSKERVTRRIVGIAICERTTLVISLIIYHIKATWSGHNPQNSG